MSDFDSLKEESKNTWGGRRKGAGRSEGSKNKATLEQKEVKKAFIERVNKNADKLFNAQFTVAVGTQMLFMIKTDSKGNKRKPEIVTDVETISRFLDENEGMSGTLDDDTEYYFMTTSRPDNAAIESLVNRSFGKATDKVEVEHTGEIKTRQLSDEELEKRIKGYLGRKKDE